RGAFEGVPGSTPDLLAATEAAEAYALGFILTDRQEFLKSAEYWADAGLSFIYFWRDRDRDLMSFASVPAFGSSEDGGTWIGAASQPVGLQYARVLLLLQHLRTNPIYEHVAKGILGSAMHQQETTGERAGLIPNRWDIVDFKESGPYVNPEHLLEVLYA